MRSTNKRDQLLEVLEAFNIEVKEGSLLSRCAKCNGTFIPRWFASALTPCLHSGYPYLWVSLGWTNVAGALARHARHLVRD